MDVAFKKVVAKEQQDLDEHFGKLNPQVKAAVGMVVKNPATDVYISEEGDIATRLTLSLDEVEGLMIHLKNFLLSSDDYRVPESFCQNMCKTPSSLFWQRLGYRENTWRNVDGDGRDASSG